MLSETGLGDVIRAWRALGATSDHERRAVARLLGFDLRDVTPEAALAPEDEALPAEPPVLAPTPLATPAPAPAAAGDPISLVPFPAIQSEQPAMPAAIARPHVAPPMLLESLFNPGWERAIYGVLGAHSAEAGALDVDRVVDLLARRAPLARLPRRARLVSATEIVVVIDTRGSLGWFRDDADQLVRRLDAVSRAPVSIVVGGGVPQLAGHGERRRARGTPSLRIGPGGRIIALTDLHVGPTWDPEEPATVAEWIGLAAAARARAATLIVVTPIPVARIPPALTRVAACVTWDRATRPGAVHRLVKSLG